ncbi:hypothetical protein Thermo_01691 [Thermoplasmatales archaeon]|nr:hypothetical protein Thermo_01691 [Thermoplasmatales archaeon]
MEMKTEKDEQARSQAAAQLANIVSMVDKLEHAQKCDGEDCELTDEEIREGLGYSYTPGDKVTDEEREEYHDEDAVRTAIEEDPLEVQVRSGWTNPGEKLEPEEFEILLCTGGPAVRIVGEFDSDGRPKRAWMEYQDWGTPWTEYLDMSSEKRQHLLTYSEQFF